MSVVTELFDEEPVDPHHDLLFGLRLEVRLPVHSGGVLRGHDAAGDHLAAERVAEYCPKPRQGCGPSFVRAIRADLIADIKAHISADPSQAMGFRSDALAMRRIFWPICSGASTKSMQPLAMALSGMSG